VYVSPRELLPADGSQGEPSANTEAVQPNKIMPVMIFLVIFAQLFFESMAGRGIDRKVASIPHAHNQVLFQ